jgi:hypothetical protein
MSYVYIWMNLVAAIPYGLNIPLTSTSEKRHREVKAFLNNAQPTSK